MEREPLPPSLRLGRRWGRRWGSGCLFPAQRLLLRAAPCSIPDVPGSRQGLSHCSSEPQCPRSHNEAPLPRAFLLPRKVVQINEITLRRSHPRPGAGSAGCGRMCGGGLGRRCHLPGLHPCPGCCSGSGEAPAADRATPAGAALMRRCSGLCRQGVWATAKGRSSLSLSSPVSGPGGPLAGAHLTPRFLWLLRSSAGLGPAPKPHPRCPLPRQKDSHCPTRSCPLRAQAPPPASRHRDAAGVGTPRSDCAAADSPSPVGESGWGGGTPPLTHPFHPLPLLAENQESRLTPPHGFRIHSQADFLVSGSSPAAPP